VRADRDRAGAHRVEPKSARALGPPAPTSPASRRSRAPHSSEALRGSFAPATRDAQHHVSGVWATSEELAEAPPAISSTSAAGDVARTSPQPTVAPSAQHGVSGRRRAPLLEEWLT